MDLLAFEEPIDTFELRDEPPWHMPETEALIATEDEGKPGQLAEQDLLPEQIGDLAEQAAEVSAFEERSEALAARMENAEDFARLIADSAKDAAERRAPHAAPHIDWADRIATFEARAESIIDWIETINGARKYLERDIAQNHPFAFSGATAALVDVEIAELRMKLAREMFSAVIALKHAVADLLGGLPNSASLTGQMMDRIHNYASNLIRESSLVGRAMADATQ